MIRLQIDPIECCGCPFGGLVEVGWYNETYNRQMSQQPSRKGSTLIRQVLKEIITEDVNVPSTARRNCSDLDKIKLTEAVTYLERKIERQHSEIKVISEQLSKEISIKEELLVLLNDEREKNGKLNLLLGGSNKQNAELKRKLGKIEKSESGEQQLKEDYELKLNKYREIVRKKDELLTKNQQKLDELQKNERNLMEIEHELKSLRESFMRLKHREEVLTVDVDSYKRKWQESQQKLKQKDETLKEKEEKVMFAEEHLRRLRVEFDELTEEYKTDHHEAKNIEMEMKRLLDRQNEQIRKLSEQQQNKPVFAEKPEWELTIFRNQLKRVIAGHIKDGNVRKKMEKDVLEVLQEMESSFNKILQQVINNFSL